MASLLQTKFGEDRVIPFHFTRPSKSELAYYFLSLVNSGRLKIYAPDEAPSEVYEECMKQLYKARYSVPSENMLNFYCDPNDCHDDVLISIALCCEAIKEFEAPVQESGIIKPRPMYRDGRY
jgi:hypothetical protein